MGSLHHAHTWWHGQSMIWFSIVVLVVIILLAYRNRLTSEPSEDKDPMTELRHQSESGQIDEQEFKRKRALITDKNIEKIDG